MSKVVLKRNRKRVTRGMSTIARYERDRIASDGMVTSLRERLSELQLREMRRPVDEEGLILDPVIPGDITRLNDVEVGKLLGEFAAMCQFVQWHLAEAQVNRAITARLEKLARARAHTISSGTVGDKAASVETDDGVVAASEAALAAASEAQLLEALFAGYTIAREVVSREITRRGSLLQHRGGIV